MKDITICLNWDKWLLIALSYIIFDFRRKLFCSSKLTVVTKKHLKYKSLHLRTSEAQRKDQRLISLLEKISCKLFCLKHKAAVEKKTNT